MNQGNGKGDKCLPPLYKEIKLEKKKCFSFMKGEECKRKFCKYSHSNEKEYYTKKVLSLERRGDFKDLDFNENSILNLPKWYRKKGKKIKKIILKKGNGIRPNELAKVTFRSYAVRYGDNGKTPVFFYEKLENYFNLKIITDGKGSVSKNPMFFHFCLESMEDEEEAVFKVDPTYFSDDLSSDMELLPHQFFYFFFVVNNIELRKKEKQKAEFKNFEDALKGVREKMDELNKEKIRIFFEKKENLKTLPKIQNFSEQRKKKNIINSDFSNGLKKVEDGYRSIKKEVNSGIFKRIEKSERDIINEIVNSVCLRIANIDILRNNYIGAVKSCDNALRIKKNNFKARYYKMMAYRKDSELDKSKFEEDRILDEIKEKRLVLTEDEKKKFENERKYLQMEMKKGVKKVKNNEKKIGKELQKGLQEGFLYKNKEKEEIENLNRQYNYDVAREKCPVWIDQGEDEDMYFIDKKENEKINAPKEFYDFLQPLGQDYLIEDNYNGYNFKEGENEEEKKEENEK